MNFIRCGSRPDARSSSPVKRDSADSKNLGSSPLILAIGFEAQARKLKAWISKFKSKTRLTYDCGSEERSANGGLPVRNFCKKNFLTVSRVFLKKASWQILFKKLLLQEHSKLKSPTVSSTVKVQWMLQKKPFRLLCWPSRCCATFRLKVSEMTNSHRLLPRRCSRFDIHRLQCTHNSQTLVGIRSRLSMANWPLAGDWSVEIRS